MTKYNLPFGTQVQGMDVLHKGNHYKNKNAHPNHLYVMGGMYRSPNAQGVDINNYTKIATITGENIIHLIIYNGVSGGSTTFTGARLTIKVDPSNEPQNKYIKEYLGTVKLSYMVVKNTSSGSTVYDVYAQVLNTGDVFYFSPLFVQNESNVNFYGYSPFVPLPANDSSHTRIYFDVQNFSQKTTVSLTFPSIPANSTVEVTTTITGVSLGDSVTVVPGTAGIEAGLMWSAYANASNTVTIRLANITGSAITPATRPWRINWFL